MTNNAEFGCSGLWVRSCQQKRIYSSSCPIVVYDRKVGVMESYRRCKALPLESMELQQPTCGKNKTVCGLSELYIIS